MVDINQVYGSQRFLKAQDLPPGKAVRLVIERAEVERLRGENSEANRIVLYFNGKQKGFVLNTTNANRIAELTHSKDTDTWPGWSISIYSTMVEFQGRRVPALRVDDRPGSAYPPQKPRATKKAQPPPPEPEPAEELSSEEWDSETPSDDDEHEPPSDEDIPF